MLTRYERSCDLLEKLYLCGINNNRKSFFLHLNPVVICLKNCTFVESTTTKLSVETLGLCCDLLEKLYLCGINNNTYERVGSVHSL